jgi:hypothetical protein
LGDGGPQGILAHARLTLGKSEMPIRIKPRDRRLNIKGEHVCFMQDLLSGDFGIGCLEIKHGGNSKNTNVFVGKY